MITSQLCKRMYVSPWKVTQYMFAGSMSMVKYVSSKCWFPCLFRRWRALLIFTKNCHLCMSGGVERKPGTAGHRNNRRGDVEGCWGAKLLALLTIKSVITSYCWQLLFNVQIQQVTFSHAPFILADTPQIRLIFVLIFGVGSLGWRLPELFACTKVPYAWGFFLKIWHTSAHTVSLHLRLCFNFLYIIMFCRSLEAFWLKRTRMLTLKASRYQPLTHPTCKLFLKYLSLLACIHTYVYIPVILNKCKTFWT